MTQTTQIDRVEPGHIIKLEVLVGSARQIRHIRICDCTPHDYTVFPPCHPLTSEYVKPFLGKEVGAKAEVEGSAGSQEWDYPTTLLAIFPADADITTFVDEGFEGVAA